MASWSGGVNYCALRERKYMYFLAARDRVQLIVAQIQIPADPFFSFFVAGSYLGTYIGRLHLLYISLFVGRGGIN